MATKKLNYIDMELKVDWSISNFPGIYCIKNLMNNKIYIGSAKDVYKRCSGHFERLRKQKHENPHLQSSFLKYGESSFQAYFVRGCYEDNLFDMEQFYIDSLDPEYNINKFATGRRGMKMPQEVIDKQIKRQSKKVFQYNINGDLVGNFHSLKAVYSYLGINKTGRLSDHLRGNLRSFKGFFWAYEGNDPIIREKKSRWQ